MNQQRAGPSDDGYSNDIGGGAPSAEQRVRRLRALIQSLLPKNQFARNVSVLVGGTATGQIIVVGASPVLTRLYSPEDFGLLAVYAGLLAILGVVASLRYQLAIPLPERDEEAASVAVLSVISVLSITLLCAVVVGIWGGAIGEALSAPALARYRWLLPLGLLLLGIYQVLKYWAIRTRSFTAIAHTKLTQAISMVGVQLGAVAAGPLALLLGHAAGQAAGSTSLAALALRGRWHTFTAVRFHDVKKVASRYRRFPLYSSWSSLLNTAGGQLPPVLFAALFSPAAAGMYLVAHRVLAMPMALLGEAVANVFFSTAAEARRQGNLARVVTGIHENLAHIAMPPVVVLILVGPDLFALAFGSDWREAGVFAQWIVVYLYFNFTASPLSTLNLVMEAQRAALVFQSALFVVRVTSILIGAYVSSVHVAIALFSLSGAAAWATWLWWLIRLSGGSIIRSHASQLTAFAWSLGLLSPFLTVFALGLEVGPIYLAAVSVSACLLVARYIFLLKRAYVRALIAQ